MKTEREKMLAGELYDPADPDLERGRARCRSLCERLNFGADRSAEERARILEALFGTKTDAAIQPPFFCDYGTNIRLGQGVYFNFNCVILDVARVEIGDRALFGPAVQIYTASHPMSAAERRSGLEFGKPVAIGSDVWIGGSAVICPGVTIGDRSVIGAGSVVTRSIPSDVFAAGNSCRVIRRLEG